MEEKNGRNKVKYEGEREGKEHEGRKEIEKGHKWRKHEAWARRRTGSRNAI